MVDATYPQVNYAVYRLKIKPAKRKTTIGPGGSIALYRSGDVDRIKKLFIDREKRQAVADSNRRKRRCGSSIRAAEPQAIPARLDGKSQAAIDIAKGRHDAITLAWLIACDKYQQENRAFYMLKSDYLQVFETMDHGWIEKLLNRKNVSAETQVSLLTGKNNNK